jgi:hypothetical protein
MFTYMLFSWSFFSRCVNPHKSGMCQMHSIDGDRSMNIGTGFDLKGKDVIFKQKTPILFGDHYP